MSGAVHLSAAFSYRDAAVAQHVRTAHPVFSWALDPEVFVFVSIQTTPDPNSPADWGFYLLLGWLGEKDTTLSNAQRLALAKKKAASIAEPFRTAVQAIPDDTILSYSDINSWVAQPWDTHQGRVTLAGDAAHPMPPYRGQGLNNAILDVQNFIKAMAKLKDSRADAGTAVALQTELIEEYSTEVVKRGAAETELSTKIAYEMLQYHDFMREVKYGLAQKAH
jgi:2-polyprenyl-6-methoxyphenol hydroxylase-like FAD-dependent oxidoreductase